MVNPISNHAALNRIADTIETNSSGKKVMRTTATISGDVNVDSTSLDMSGYVGKVGAVNADFSTAYASSTSIQLADLPSDITAFTADDIASIVQINSDGLVVETYTRDDSIMTITGNNVLNVADASFSPGDSFVVYTNVPRPGAAGADDITAEYMSPDDFSATYTSPTTITLSGLPFTIADSSQVIGIKVISSAGEANIFKSGINGVTITVSSNVLTISGAGSPFASGDVYQVGINAQKKAYDPSTNSNMTLPLKNVWNQVTDEEALIENGSLTSSFTQAGSDIDMRGFNVLRAGTVVVNGTSTGITLRIVQKLSDGSYIPIDGLSDITLNSSMSYSFDLPAIETVAFQIKDDASGDGTVSIYINKSWGR